MDLQNKIVYQDEQLGIASDMYAELREELDYDTKHLLGLLDQVVERDRTIIEAQQETIEALERKEFSMAQCIGELENDVDELTQLYLDQLERTNEVGEELWELKMQIDLIGTSQEDQTCPFCHAPYEVDITYPTDNEDCPEWLHEDTDMPF